MKHENLKDPILLSVILCCLITAVNLGLLLWMSMSDRRQSGSPALLAERAQSEEALTLAKEHLEKGDYSAAYDLILVSSRLNPTDPQLLDLVIAFLGKANASGDQDGSALADELYNRAESLIHFQRPERVIAARKKYDEIVQQSNKSDVKNENPSAEVRDLLTVAENPQVRLQTRALAIEKARDGLEELALSQAALPKEAATADLASPVQQLQSRIDKAEQAYVGQQFDDVKKHADDWLESTKSLLIECEKVKPEDMSDATDRIDRSVGVGVDLVRELVPYAKFPDLNATERSKQAEDQVAALQRMKTCLYNQQILQLIRDVESHKDWNSEKKIRKLAEVDEELLSPYVLRRHRTLWETEFEGLKTEDWKVWAVKQRILKGKG